MRKKLEKVTVFLAFSLLSIDSVFAAQAGLRVTKANSVVVYKEPSAQSRAIVVLKEGQVVEVESQQGGWLKVKIPYNNTGYFVTGWVNQRSSGYVITGMLATAPRQMPTTNRPSTIRPAPTPVTVYRPENTESDSESNSKGYIRGFFGPVYSLNNYGAFQYRLGVSYDMPMTENVKIGFPISYMTGDGFSSLMFAITPMYSINFGVLSFTTHAGVGFEYLFGNGKSFNAIDGEMGITFGYAVSDHVVLGFSPITAQAMVWNSTDTLNEIPFNVRGQSMLELKGSW